MAVEKRDPHTGYLTTGHEWNGITELNTPVPRVVWFFLITTALFSLGYWILMPAWPLGVSFTKGLLGVDQRTTVAAKLQEAALDRSVWTKRIEAESFKDIEADPQLMKIVRETGRTLFGDNCTVCHGTDASGGKGFPNLTTASWLWGGDADAIAETIRVGINSAHPQTRTSQMLAFGRDGVLPRKDIENVVNYVRTLSDPAVAKQVPAASLEAGAKAFADNCASCHGEQGKGNVELGAPDLTDKNWIYGGDAQSIFTSVWGGRQGHMPTWEHRLSSLDRKILTLYLVGLRAAKP
ncbi:MAG TPA: cytochrome-c oxidase, cbb3-type subunit III [Pseudolabrys sp.]|nr:cytochrome-c oxidase, cbb3-type subunit III [Pseudolabrys sp.]